MCQIEAGRLSCNISGATRSDKTSILPSTNNRHRVNISWRTGTHWRIKVKHACRPAYQTTSIKWQTGGCGWGEVGEWLRLGSSDNKMCYNIILIHWVRVGHVQVWISCILPRGGGSAAGMIPDQCVHFDRHFLIDCHQQGEINGAEQGHTPALHIHWHTLTHTIQTLVHTHTSHVHVRTHTRTQLHISSGSRGGGVRGG